MKWAKYVCGKQDGKIVWDYVFIPDHIAKEPNNKKLIMYCIYDHEGIEADSITNVRAEVSYEQRQVTLIYETEVPIDVIARECNHWHYQLIVAKDNYEAFKAILKERGEDISE